MNNNTSRLRMPFRNALLVAGVAAALGIVPAAAVAADTAMPQAHSDGVRATLSDTAITAKVKARLMGNDSLKHSDIDVTTTNGVVTLNGTVSSTEAGSLAATEAGVVEGVKSVDNSLKSPSSNSAVTKTKRVASDSWISTKVKSEILEDSMSKGFKVSVKTKHGVVMLSGALASQDAIDHVKDVAAKVTGVKSVDTSALTVK